MHGGNKSDRIENYKRNRDNDAEKTASDELQQYIVHHLHAEVPGT
jgi:hypothetical protein